MEAEYEQMMEESIKGQFVRNGTMAGLRSELHVKVLQMMRGQMEKPKTEALMGSVKVSEDRGLITLINQLIMEFFQWFGYRHSLETFKMETGEKMASRRDIEQKLTISPDSKDLPLLAQLIMRDWKSDLDKVGTKRMVQVPDPDNSKPKVPKVQEELPIKQTKLVQNNRKLIENDPFRKTTVVKQMKQIQKQENMQITLTKPEQKQSMETSESDLDSYYSDSEDSEPYADIPDRQIYMEELPPEGKYDPGHGEEGPYQGMLLRYQREPNSDDAPSSSKKSHTTREAINKPSRSKTYEVPESKNEPKLIGKMDLEHQINKCLSSKSSKSFKTVKEQFWSKRLPDCDETPVTKPECPETHIGSSQLDSDESCEYEDLY